MSWYKNIKNFKERAIKCRDLLREINSKLTEIEKIDPYGDILENFCELDKTTRHTTRIIKQINSDLKEYDKEIKVKKCPNCKKDLERHKMEIDGKLKPVLICYNCKYWEFDQ